MAISNYSQPLQSLNQAPITPLPFQEMLAMSQYTQKRYDDSLLATEDQYSNLASTSVVDANKAGLENLKSQFSVEMSDLLDKYKGQTYSADFQRESKKLISKMASDPLLKLMKENKLQSDLDDETIRKMAAQRIEYYDPRLNNPNAFVNPDGTIKSYKAGVRALTYDNQIDEQGSKALQAMVQNGADINNFAQLNKAKDAALKPSSSIYKDKYTSLIQQGYTPKDADRVAKEYITQRFDSFKKRVIDSGMLEYGLKVAKLQAEANANNPNPLQTVPAAPSQQPGNFDLIGDIKTKVKRAKNGLKITEPSNFNPFGVDINNLRKEALETKEEAKAYFGNKASTFKNDDELLDAYSKAVEQQIGSGPVSTRRYPNNKANEALGKHILASGFKVTKLNKHGKPEAGVGKMVDIKNADEELVFKGMAAVDVTGESPISFYYTNKDDNKKEYVASIPAEVAIESFPASYKLGRSLNYFGPLSDKESGLLPKDYWFTEKDEYGRQYTMVPLRKYDKENNPRFSVAKVYDADGTSYAQIKTKLNNKSTEITSLDEIINFETERYFNDLKTTGQSLGTVE